MVYICQTSLVLMENMVIDSTACQVTTANYWVAWNNKFLDLLSTYDVVLFIVLVVGLAGWIWPRRRWLRLTRRTGALFLASYLLLSTPIAVNLGSQALTSMVPSDHGQPADAIVVLGRGGWYQSHRVETVTQLWRQGRAPRIFASGRGDAPKIAENLKKNGIPAMAIGGEPCSSTTNENAEYTAALLLPQGIKNIILVTDPPHIMRSWLTFRSFGFQVIPHTAPSPDNLSRKREVFVVFKEGLGLFSYGLLGRYFSRDIPQEVFKTEVTDPFYTPEL